MNQNQNNSTEMEHRKTISVTALITAYNAEEYIARAIDSVLNQTHPADEIIVINDGSTDDTEAAIKPYLDRVTYYSQANAGASTSRNVGIEKASHDWIAFLDGDDEWLPDKLEKQIEILKQNPDIMWCAGNFMRCLCEEDRQGPDKSVAYCQKQLNHKPVIDSYFSAYRKGLTGHTNTMLIHREALTKAGGFMTEQKRINDLDTWWRITYHYPAIGYVATPIAIHHLDVSNSITRTYNQAIYYRMLLNRQLQIATELKQLKQFKPVGSRFLSRYLRSMLFDANAKDIRSMLNEFGPILPWWRRGLYYILTAFPRFTARSCHLISKLVRRLKLRRTPVRSPKKLT